MLSFRAASCFRVSPRADKIACLRVRVCLAGGPDQIQVDPASTMVAGVCMFKKPFVATFVDAENV